MAATSGAMGGSRSEEFLTPTRDRRGHVRPVARAATRPTSRRSRRSSRTRCSCDDAPAAHVEDTPDTPTIDSLVAVANERFARPDRAWTAADTLKNVVLALVHPTGERELLVVGLPGDREVDLKRLGGAVSPGRGRAVRRRRLRGPPRAGPRVHRPGAIGPNVAVAEGAERTAVRYLLDPRVVAGTRWITGANEPGRHVFDLVAGRDFTADGAIEAAEVRAGDPAPDGSGPLELARGSRSATSSQLGRKYAEALGLTVLDQNGKRAGGDHGLVRHRRDPRAWPPWPRPTTTSGGSPGRAHVAPAHVTVVATGKDPAVFEAAEALAVELSSRGVEVIYDDRPGRVSPGVKFADAELLGVPLVVVVGRGLAEGVVEVRPRTGGTTEQVPVDQAADHVAALVTALLTA